MKEGRMTREKWIKTVAVFVVLIGIVYVYSVRQGPDREEPDRAEVESTTGAVSEDLHLPTASTIGEEETIAGERGGIRSPIELQLTLLAANEIEGDDSGGEVVVGIDLKPLIEAPEMRWFLQVPEGLVQTSGVSSWEGRMESGEEKSFQMTLSVPDGRRYELYSRAEIYLDNGDVITKGAGLRIDLGPEDTGPYPPFERVDEKGRKVITFKGESEGGGQ
jgi:hypothetical protein